MVSRMAAPQNPHPGRVAIPRSGDPDTLAADAEVPQNPAMHACVPRPAKIGRPRPGRSWLLLCAIACLLAWLPLRGNPGAGFSGFHHTAWSLQDGAPADIWAIAQSDDGYLWLGTGFGLYRFDGVRFERFESVDGAVLPSGNITALAVLPSGEIWIGYYHGGFSRIRAGQLSHYGVDDGVPSGMVYRIVQDAAGELWAAIGSGLLHYRDGRWQDARVSTGYPQGAAYWVEPDADGALWVASERSLLVRRAGNRGFDETGIALAPAAVLATSPEGDLWASDAAGGTRPVVQDRALVRDGGARFPALAAIEAARLLFLPDGTLWGTRRGQGAFKVLPPAGGHRLGRDAGTLVTQSFARANGLTSDTAVPVFADREGNVWVGTILGLNRFRYRNVMSLPVPLADPDGYDQAIRGDDGAVLIASSRGRLMHIDRAAMRRLLDGGALADEVARTRADAWWLREGRELWRFEAGRATAVDFPGAAAGATADAMMLDHRRRLWISVRDRGVFMRGDVAWQRRPEVPAPAPTVMAAGFDGTLWFGYKDGRVVVLDGGRVELHDPGNGLGVGPVTALHVGRRHIVAAGELGIARFEDGRFRTFSGDDVLSGVTGILESDEGFLWFNGSRGVVRMAGDSLAQALAEPARAPTYVLFDQSDGLPGVALQTKPTASAANADGLFWFSTNGGMALIDPERVRINARPPDVHVLSLSTGGSTMRAGSVHVLPPRTSNLQIAYTATSLSAPERVRFRYRLEGVDETWRDAGTRREAFYTNLGPGHYRFHVVAANNDGVWNEEGARLAFRIRPTFFQSPWFVLACVLLAAIAIYVAYLLHLRQVAMRLRARLEERHLERERIARELHDTLLQSVQGLILRLHALAAPVEQGTPLRQGMESVMDRAEAVLVEGRERVRGLRAAREVDDLQAAFVELAREFGEGAPDLQVIAPAAARRLRPLVRDELYRIGREAVLNAVRHARATLIEVRVDYADDALGLSVSDDGIGIDPAILARGDRPGHWGLAGMRERMEWIGGRLEIASRVGSGTRIRATVPGGRAYPRHGARWRRWLRALRRPGA